LSRPFVIVWIAVDSFGDQRKQLCPNAEPHHPLYAARRRLLDPLGPAPSLSAAASLPNNEGFSDLESSHQGLKA
jgi:hypothetical protein